MKRLLLFALVLAAGGYGWKHSDELRSRGTHELVAVNRSGHAIVRLRLSVGGEARAIETLEDGATARTEWRCEHDGAFRLEWKVRGREGERQWSGGAFYPGPLLMRHRFEFTSGDGVIWLSEPKSPKASRRR